jgi:hypothetical protein
MSRGGYRHGSGRPESDKTVVRGFRVHYESLQKAMQIHGKKLGQLVNNFIKQLANENN